MNKFVLTILTVTIMSVTGNSIMADSNKPCSKSRLLMKANKNQQQAQQEQMLCNRGNRDVCKKAQEDFQDARKYHMKAMRCPFP